MKTLLALILLLVSLPALADPRACDFQPRSDGGFALNCGGGQVASTPTPVTTPPAPTPAPRPAPAGVEVQALAANNASAIHTGSAGVIYTFPLPRCEMVQCQFEMGSTPGTPTEMDAEVGFSRTPGDLWYWRTAAFQGGRGGTFFPCGLVAGASQGFSVRWGNTGGFDVCQTNPMEQWYVSVRYGPACGASCRVAYKVNFK